MDNLTEYRLANAKEKLESAKLLLDAGKYKDSIGRSYYAIFMIFCKALRSKKLWCWTIVRTSLTFHLLLSITLTGTIILTLIR